MGNAESSGGGHGGKEEGKREQETQDGQSRLETALKIGAVMTTTAIVASVASRVLSHSDAEEGEKPAAHAGGSSSRPERVGYEASGGSAAVPAVWSRPPKGRLKLNTDFSGPSGIGCIIRDHLAKMHWCCAERVDDRVIKDHHGEIIWISTGQVSDSDGEALALLRGLVIARDSGYKNIIAETDHKSNADSINNLQNKASVIIKKIRQAKCIWFENCEVRYIMRERNRCANHLAGVAARWGHISFDELKESPDLLKLLKEDEVNSRYS